MADVRDVVTDALRDLGVLAAGETATADDANVGLSALNGLVDEWASGGLAIYRKAITTWSLVAAQASYTVASGGNVAVARPNYVDHVNYRDSAGVEVPLAEWNAHDWSRVTVKTQTGTAPTHWYYDPTFPSGTLYLWPITTLSTLTGVMYAPAAVSEFTSLSTAISLPPGYRRALVKNLALELAPQFGRPPSPLLVRAADESLAKIKTANVVIPELDCGVMTGASFDIHTGE